MKSSTGITKIAVALLAAQREMGAALKDAKNPFFKSSYADMNSVIDASLPVLNKHGITILQPTVTLELLGGVSKSVIETTLLHESGEWLSSQTDIICAKQNDPQAYGSAISYARRYGLQAFVMLKGVDDDGELAQGRGNTAAKGAVANSTIKADLSASGLTAGPNGNAVVTPTKVPSGFATKGKMNGKSAGGNAANSGFGN
jgi:hypothetical protein